MLNNVWNAFWIFDQFLGADKSFKLGSALGQCLTLADSVCSASLPFFMDNRLTVHLNLLSFLAHLFCLRYEVVNRNIQDGILIDLIYQIGVSKAGQSVTK